MINVKNLTQSIHNGSKLNISSGQKSAPTPVDITKIVYQSSKLHIIDEFLNSGIQQAQEDNRYKLMQNGKYVENIIKKNNSFFIEFYPSLFWLTHIMIVEEGMLGKFDSSVEFDANELLQKCGKMWVHFIFPLQESLSSKDPEIFDLFVRTFPIFTSQVFLFIFISLTHGHQSTTSSNFRSILTEFLIFVFSSIHPSKELINSELLFVFDHPPRVDIPETPPSAQYSTNLSLPSEDLSTLVDLEHRIPGSSSIWYSNGISPLISAGTGENSLPLEKIQKVKLQKATKSLPPLFYDLSTSKYTSKEDYAPSKEPRSLLLRSERKGLAEALKKKKESSMEMRNQIERYENEQKHRSALLKRAVIMGTKGQVGAFQNLLDQMDTNGRYEITDWMLTNFPGIDSSSMKSQKDPTVKLQESNSQSRYHTSVFTGTASKQLFYSTFI